MIERRQLIRHIACSYDGPIVAVAEFERFVQIWDVDSRRRIAALETTLDFGGNRLAISRDGNHCAVGAYYVHGIALYDTSNGTEIWRRKDLKEVQTIRMSIDGERILCGFEGKSFEPLDLKTGRSKPAMRGVKDVIESIYDDLVVIDRKGRDYKLTNGANKQIAALPRATPATLDFAFGPQRLCISDCAGSVRCFDTNTGEQIWEHNPGNGIHALELTFNESGNAFAGITWPYEKGGVYQLVNLHPDTGDMVTEVAITNAHEFAFCCKGSRLLSSDGSLRDTATGNVVALLEFFPTEKPPG